MVKSGTLSLPIFLAADKASLDPKEPLVDLAKFRDGIPRLSCVSIGNKPHLMIFSSSQLVYRFFGTKSDQYLAIRIDETDDLIRLLDSAVNTHDRFVVNAAPGKKLLATGSIAELLDILKKASQS